jgi:hypothetical protein
MKFFCLISTLAPASIVATMAAAGPEDVVPANGVFYFTPVTSTTSGAALSVPTASTNVTTTTNTTNTTTLSGVGTAVTLANANVFCPNRLPNAVDSCWFLMTIISPDSYVFLFYCLLAAEDLFHLCHALTLARRRQQYVRLSQFLQWTVCGLRRVLDGERRLSGRRRLGLRCRVHVR